MKYQASFVNRQADTIKIEITTADGSSAAVNLDDGSAGAYISASDAVTIESSASDTFDHLLESTAKISLLTEYGLFGLFCASVFDAPVRISCNGACVFSGYLTPQTYDQDFVEAQDQLQLNCVDALAALQYAKYKNVGDSGVDYAQVKLKARQLSLLDIMKGIFSTVSAAVGSAPRVFYDGSRAIDATADNRYSIFAQVSVNELLFLGDEEDDVWQQDEVLEEILRYLNLHILQRGTDFYIFDWASVRSAQKVEWHDVMGSDVLAESISSLALSPDSVDGASTSVSVGECFNKLILTCDLKEIDDVVESPLESDSLSDAFPGGRQHYMTEYSAEGNGYSAFSAFNDMVKCGATDWSGATVTEWFLKVMRAQNWRFFSPFCGDIAAQFFTGKNQQYLPNCLSENIGAAVLSLGKVEKTNASKDNALTNSISMEEQLVISTGAFCRDAQVSDEEFLNVMDSLIKQSMPVAEYTGNVAGGTFSPSDDGVTNYICIDGKMILNPHMKMTGRYSLLYDYPWKTYETTSKVEFGPDADGYVHPWHRTVASRTNGDGRYYTRKYFRADTPRSGEAYDPAAAYPGLLGKEAESYGFCPFTDKGDKLLEFKYSGVGDSSDQVSKVGVLCCMLVIGDKCVVEKTPDNDLGTGVPYTGQGFPEDFVWMPYKELSQCASEDEYYRQSFSIGFNPKIGDYLVGTKFDMQLNHSYQLGIDDDGIAIPVRKGDRVNGQVRFSILGPYNAVWNNVVRRHPTLFRHTKWTENSVPLLRKVSSIIITDFSVKVCSDSGLTNTAGNRDLVYMSDTAEAFVNKKDDITFKLSSALTSAEAAQLGVKNAVSMSTPLNMADGSGLLSVFDHVSNTQAKPEQLYVDAYYSEYHAPRITMKQTLKDAGCHVSPFLRLRHDALARDFYPYSLSRNLMDGSATLETKECFDSKEQSELSEQSEPSEPSEKSEKSEKSPTTTIKTES